MNKSIRVLKFPINLTKEIESLNIYNVLELTSRLSELNLSKEDLEAINKRLAEYKRFQLNNELTGYREVDKYAFINEKYKLEDLHLSLRAMNALNNFGVYTISKLLLIIDQMEIYSVENLGTKSIIQVMESVMEIVEKENLQDKIPIYNSSTIIDDVEIYNMDFTLGAISSLEKLKLFTLGAIRKAYLTGELSNMFNYKTLGVVINKLQKYYDIKPDPEYSFFKLFLIEDKLGFISILELRKYIEDNLEVDSDDVIKRLSKDPGLILEKDRIRLPYFLEKIRQVKLKKESEEILLDRFSGNTLQSVADRFGKTRERIRQIVRDRMMNINNFYEESFIKEYNKYVWHPSVFMKVYGISELSFNIIKYLGNKYSFEEEYEFPEEYVIELMETKKVPYIDMDEFKNSLPDVFAPRVEIYGESYDKMSKREFLEFVIENHVDNKGLHKNKIIKIANKVAKDNNIDYYYDKYIDIVTNTIQGLQNVRFYNYDVINEEALNEFKKILYQVDSVYSCTYFFLLYEDLMKKYDIRDGYELHFLLRKYFSKAEEFEGLIEFNRQPMIAKVGMTFSNVVLNAWKEMGSITQIDEFADELIEKHGYHRGTLINVINSTLGDYISLRNIYPYVATLKNNVGSKIKEIMKDEFYELGELAKIFAENGISEENYQYFSNSWLKDFGYKTHDINYIIKFEYSSLKNVFYDRVLSHNVYQLSEKDHKMRETTLILFIESLREEYLAFPTKGNKLVSMKYLESKGIKKADIVEYVRALEKYLKKEEYFTYFSLKKNNYQKANPIFEKIENYNLDKELMVSFIRNVTGIKKTTKGNLYRISKKPTTISEFIAGVAEKKGITDQKELKNHIKENYGVTIRNADI